MKRYLLSRLLQIIPVIVLVSFAVFSMTLLVPGDPTITVLGEMSTVEQRAALRESMGLDLPIPVQYGNWLHRTLSGDLGRALRSQEPVIEMLRQRVPLTLQLTLMSIALAILIGVPCGILAALKRNTWVDTGVSFFALSNMALPHFWTGMLLIMLFCIYLGWLPPSGYIPFFDDPLQSLKLMFLPSLTVGAGLAGLVMRQTRAAMLEVLSADYIRTAKAKGARDRRVLLHHALPNAAIPVVTVVGLQVGALMGGAVVTETVFSLPGLGSMMVNGIFERDFPSVQGAILVVVLCILLLNLLIDVSYQLLDKRISS
jgi:peptide/nickel transport system permease protein